MAFAHMGAAEDDSMSRRYVLSAGLIASSLLLGPTGGECLPCHPTPLAFDL